MSWVRTKKLPLTIAEEKRRDALVQSILRRLHGNIARIRNEEREQADGKS